MSDTRRRLARLEKHLRLDAGRVHVVMVMEGEDGRWRETGSRSSAADGHVPDYATAEEALEAVLAEQGLTELPPEDRLILISIGPAEVKPPAGDQDGHPDTAARLPGRQDGQDEPQDGCQ